MDYENQHMLETLFNERQTPKLLRKQLLENDELCTRVVLSTLDEEFALDLLAQMLLHRRATVPTLVGLLYQHFPAGNSRQRCANALLLAVQHDLVDFDPSTDQFITRYLMDATTEKLLGQYQFLPPMLVPPLEVTESNRGSGYLNVRTDSLLLQDQINHHEGDLCVDSLNRFNTIPLSVNTEVVKRIRNDWKHLDRPKAGESFEDFQQRREAFIKYERDAFFTIALMAETGNRFYLTHKVDKRGRTYAQGYHINPQGNCWNKAVVEFADKELVQ